MPKVSVHIVTYNSGEDIAECLHAVVNQTLQPSHIVVVDNNSADNTLTYVAPFKQITVIRNHFNAGFAGAHNQAMQITESDYVLVLNPDVTLHPDYLYKIINFLETNPQYGSATGMLLRKSNNYTIDSTGIIMFKNRRAADRGAGEPSESYLQSSDVFGVSGAAAVYRRKMIQDISWQGQFFDEDFFAYKEDVDVSWRAQLMGWKAYYVADAVAYHERGWKEGTRFTKPLFVRKFSYINRYKMMLKNESPRYLLKHTPWLLPYEIASIGYTLLRDPKLLGSWRSFFKEYPRLLEKRKWIQERRRESYANVYKYFL